MKSQSLSVRSKLTDFFKALICDLWDIMKTIVEVTAVVIVLTQVFIVSSFVPTSSMSPTVSKGSLMLCLRTDYWFNTPQRGDIVVFRRDDGDYTLYAKRVVGIPGDIVEIIHGVTYINGEKYDEPWLAETPIDEVLEPFEVPAGEYFCMGDNRNHSYDCRYWEETYIPEENILARGRIAINVKDKAIKLFQY